jgi:peptidoglycan/LPS O-acetylase OafA/YrhL
MDKWKNNSNEVMSTNWIWGVKGLAVLSIVLYHWFSFFPEGFLGQAIRSMAEGAHTFFTLSAFGLYLSLAKGKHQIDMSWFLKRFSKVLVPYYMAVMTVCLSIVIYGALIGNIPDALRQFDLNPKSLLASIFLYRGFFDNYVFIINTAWWFVIAILQFYLIFPLLCFFYRKTSGKFFLGSILFINLFYQYVCVVTPGLHSPVFAKLFPSFLFEFSIGIYLADLFLNNPSRFFKLTLGMKPFLIGVSLRLFSLFLTLYTDKGYVFTDVFTATGFALIIYNLYYFISQNIKLKQVCDWIGRYSLSIFLLHEAYIVIIFNLLKNTNHPSVIIWPSLFFYSCFTVAISFLFQQYLINRNFLIKKYFVKTN